MAIDKLLLPHVAPFDLKHAVLEALHALNQGMEEGLELAGVEETQHTGGSA